MQTNSKVNRHEEAQKLLKNLDELDALTQLEENIKDNKVYFTIDKIKYRIRKPIPKEQIELDDYKRRKYHEFINDDTMLFRDQWIEKYKSKGISIEDMDKKMENLREETKRVQIKLAQTTNKEGIKSLKKNIEKMKTKMINLFVKKQDLLSYSIEESLIVEMTSYCSYLVLEKENGDKYEKVFKDYDEFLKCENEKLLNTSFYYVTQFLQTREIAI